jgi:hypothetical protein
VAAGVSLLVLVAVLAPSALADERVPALSVLMSLPVGPERNEGYDRDLFRHWSDPEGNGCDAREDVLIAERVAGRVAGCTVIGGRWVSAYDGVRTSNSSSFDIDHVVALAEAWGSGAWRWNAATRERFANDLGYAGSLIAVSASSNRSKSDRDPAEWLPELAVCAYAKRWVAVKYRWRLSVDSAERAALQGILRDCPPTMRLPGLAATG